MIGFGRRAGWWGRGLALGGLCAAMGIGVAQSGGVGAKAPGCVAVGGARADGAKPDGTGKGCPAGEHVPSVAEQFPFPGAAAPAPKEGGQGGEGKTVKDRFPYPGEAVGEAPKAGDGGVKDRFPYPGEKGEPSSGAEGSSSSSSSSGGAVDGDGKAAFKDEGSDGEAQPQHRRRLRPPAQKTLSDDERVEEDLSVAHFYEQSGNARGAYLRAQDAVKLQPGAADTHLALATAAEKLGKRDEAIAQYTAALAAAPDEDAARGAKKALERLKR